MTTVDDAIHRSLVEALGEPEALAALGPGLWLPGAQWAAAVQRARRKRFPDASEDEGLFRVGEALGDAFLRQGAGQVLAETLPVLSLERVFGLLMPVLAERLRRRFDVTWESTDSGGSLHIRGPVSLPPAATAGFFERIVREVDPRARVTVGLAEERHIEMVVRRGG